MDMDNMEEDTQETNSTAMSPLDLSANTPLDLSTNTPLPIEGENMDDSVIFITPHIDTVDLTSPTQPQHSSAFISTGAGTSKASSALLGQLTFEEPSCSKDALKDSTCSSLTENATSTALGSPLASSSNEVVAAAAAASSSTAISMECPICLQTCMHPAKLPCGHIFCFLCVKGFAYKNRRCAMCRREIPYEFLDHPQLVNGIEDICTTKTTDDGYQWFYEGRNGWWQYDDRTSQDLEDAFKKGERSCTILVAGYVYIVDFDSMIQQRQNEPARCRRVKRDLATIPKKGVAGLRIEGNTVTTDSNFAQHMYQTRQSRYHSVDNDDLESIDNTLLRSHSVDSSNSQGPLRLSYGLGGYVIELGNPIEFVSTSAATDAALRIASDIIGSTLAHADELTRSSSNMLTANSSTYQHQGIMDTDSIQNPATGELNLNDLLLNSRTQQQQQQLVATATSGSYMGRNTSTPSSSPLTGGGHILPHERGSRELLGAAEDLLGATQRVIASADQPTIDLFEQTLNDYHTLTLRNIVDSSDDDESHQQAPLRMQQQISNSSLPPNGGQRSQTSQNQQQRDHTHRPHDNNSL